MTIIPKRCTEIDEECAAIGACIDKNVDKPLYELLEPLVTSVPDVITKFGRLLLRREIYHSQMYKRPTRRNDYTIVYEDACVEIWTGVILLHVQI